MLAGLVIVGGVWFDLFSELVYLSLIPWLAAIFAFLGVRKYCWDIGKLVPYMGLNVSAALLTPLIFGLLLIFTG